MESADEKPSRRYPPRPVLGVGALVFSGEKAAGEKILLVERGQEPLKGWWSLPGGGVETGERLEEALRREVREETGVEIDQISFFEIFERLIPDDTGRTEYHYVLIDYLCRLAGGTLCAADDAGSAQWFTEAEIDGLKITTGTSPVIHRAFAYLRNAMSAGK